MKISGTGIAGVWVVETSPLTDRRGAFARLYCERELAPVIESRRIVQINFSITAEVGAVRGLHYQRSPYAEMKLVRCVKGRVWDVAVDLRAGSPTFLRWHAEEVTADNMRMLVIPEGCAHGFQTLEANSHLLYLHTAFYSPEAEGGIFCNEPRLGINWPLPVADLSRRDSSHPSIADFLGIVV